MAIARNRTGDSGPRATVWPAGGEMVSALLKEPTAHAGKFRLDEGREVELRGIGPQRVQGNGAGHLVRPAATPPRSHASKYIVLSSATRD
jgi:hypothetical protein